MAFLSHETEKTIREATETYTWAICGPPIPKATLNDKGEPELKYELKTFHLLMTEEVRKAFLDLNESLGKYFPRTY